MQVDDVWPAFAARGSAQQTDKESQEQMCVHMMLP